ncbi:hypothetical protein [Flexilinea flocculi]|uniref:Uncharacterized protein n=1 Tax=Flexilinea flocculi TaxID=1678840 RepID=A0A0K8PA56_9CHLR|nr:hypothetical protein [Flexilinea flocculi]GAP39521.1 hypothetical protein ATC1_1251 [Flexilinea flocculi]
MVRFILMPEISIVLSRKSHGGGLFSDYDSEMLLKPAVKTA